MVFCYCHYDFKYICISQFLFSLIDPPPPPTPMVLQRPFDTSLKVVSNYWEPFKYQFADFFRKGVGRGYPPIPQKLLHNFFPANGEGVYPQTSPRKQVFLVQKHYFQPFLVHFKAFLNLIKYTQKSSKVVLGNIFSCKKSEKIVFETLPKVPGYKSLHDVAKMEISGK